VSYSENEAGPALAPFVERLCFSNDEGPGASPGVRVVPDGAIDVLFSVARDGGSGTAHVFGLKTRSLWVETPDARDNVLLRLRPGAAERVFGVRASELTDRALPLRELAGTEADAWLERLARTRSNESRARVAQAELGRWFRARARVADADDALLAHASARLGRPGAPRVAALAQALGVGERRLERLFLARIGVTPKAYARIARFQATYRELGAGAELVSLALAHGYFDQAHLNRDFRELAGAPPRRIFPSRDRPAHPSLPG